ncbi:hypothetical protein N7505_010237 [Penicillium chrysogenum]|uniref:Uncharacterized protein n=1 Tax=Penicillium chrysogenum TaxID=5076 RepID=A0ABQ8W5V1_PENCH|nr:hypothetical protein N7505_010237 [Penicillium chrysogenum]
MLYNQAWKPGPQIWQTNGAIRSYYSSYLGKTSEDKPFAYNEAFYSWNCINKRDGPRYDQTPKSPRLPSSRSQKYDARSEKQPGELTAGEHPLARIHPEESYHCRRLRTARRIAEVCALPSTGNPREATEDVENQSKRPKLHYLELNALSARLASEMAAQSNEPTTATGRGRGCHFLDGGISWGPPQSTQDCSWKKPSVKACLSLDWRIYAQTILLCADERSYRVDEVDVVGVVGAGGILLAHCCTRDEWVIAMSPKPYRWEGNSWDWGGF